MTAALSPARIGRAPRCSAFWGTSLKACAAPELPSRARVNAGKHILRAVSMPATTKEDPGKYAPGKHVVIEEAMRTPISLKRFWSAFDDFAALQSFVHSDGDPRPEAGRPVNGVGAQFSYNFCGCRMVITYVIFSLLGFGFVSFCLLCLCRVRTDILPNLSETFLLLWLRS
jgi:hypothetical protein